MLEIPKAPLQYSCLKNPLNRGAWQAIVYRVSKSWTRLKRLSTALSIYKKTYMYRLLFILFMGSSKQKY